MAKAARHADLDANGTTLGDLFQTPSTIYQTPLFQRKYVWGRKQLTELMGDIQVVLDGLVETRFLGAVVLSAGRAVPGKATTSLIVDGQQRLTTLFLLIAAIAELAAPLPDGEDLVEEAIDAIVNRVGKTKGRPKLEPTLQDRRQFEEIVRRLEPVIAGLGLKLPLILHPPYGPADGNLKAAFGLVLHGLNKNLEAAEKSAPPGKGDKAKLEYLTSLFDVLANHLKFVAISLGDDDDPHQVFDRLNSAGIKLKVSDLVRNEVFERLSDDPAAAEALANGAWRKFEDELGDTLEDFVFTYGLIKRPTTTKGRLLQELREVWSKPATLTAKAILDDMARYVQPFLLVAQRDSTKALPALSRSLPKATRAQAERLRMMPIPASVYPFATMAVKAVADGTLADAEAAKSLRLVESFLIRRAFAGLEPTGLHVVFKSAWGATSGNAAKLVKAIEDRQTVSFPDDKDFEKAIRTRPVYTMRLMPYVLRAYEASLKGDQIPASSSLSIDHVMPQSLKAGWTRITPAQHSKLKDTWANLVPLTTPQNSSKNNLPWAKVRNGLLAESIWKTPRGLAQKYKTWGPTEIGERADLLVAWANKTWPRHP